VICHVPTPQTPETYATPPREETPKAVGLQALVGRSPMSQQDSLVIYETSYHQQQVRYLQKKAPRLGFQLVPA